MGSMVDGRPDEVSEVTRDVDVGGLSGCPVFAVRSELEVVGVVTTDTGSVDGLRVRSTKFIDSSGIIKVSREC